MKLEDIDLHDALVLNAAINYKEKEVILIVQYYKSSIDKKRKNARIFFEGVSVFSEISDFDELEKNAFAGQINHWVPAQRDGTTYVYLVNGLISIKSKFMRFEEDQVD